MVICSTLIKIQTILVQKIEFLAKIVKPTTLRRRRRRGKRRRRWRRRKRRRRRRRETIWP